jgi:signal transduction histidine kinase
MPLLSTIIRIVADTIGRALFGGAARELVDWKRARFRDKEIERAYHRHLIDVELPKDRLVNYGGIGIYYIFGILDFLTFKEHLAEVLILRWGVCGPIALGIVSMSLHPRFKQRFMIGTASVMLIGSLSIIAMIALAPPSGAPPYLVGVFAIFILFACVQRLSFAVATAIYLVSFAAWSATVTAISPKEPVEVISGHFFFAWISIVAIATSYFQEIQSRFVYYRNRQREEDAAYIQQLLIEATAADRSKSNFLSILSHELRTPLHQIIGFSEVLQNDPAEKPGEYLSHINASAKQLLARLGKMMRYADAAAGTIKYDPEAINASEILSAVAEQMREKAQRAGVAVNADRLDPASIRIDAQHTIYALSNLVENAIAASKSGQTVTISGAGLPSGAYEIRIDDNGAGMSERQIEAALKPFSIASDVKTRSLEGVGLGLTLADKIVKDQGGALAIHSRPGKGTSVIIEFPPAAERAAA